MIGPLSVSSLPSIKFDGFFRVLGCLPSKPEKLAKFPKFGENFQTLTSNQWQEIDLEHYNLPILNQGSSSSCVGHGCASGCELAWMQAGRDLQEFSPWFLYALVNGGRDAGASISDALDALQNTGICPRSDVPEGVLFENQLPQKAMDDASNHKIVKAFHCRDYAEICSAISLGFPTPLGISVGQNFVQLDDEGVAPLPFSILGGHCLLGIGLKKSAKYGWVIKVKNSWGDQFGIRGCCYLQEGALNYMQPDAFAIQMMSVDSNDPNAPPVVV